MSSGIANQLIPSPPKTDVVFPLDKGMVRNVPATQVPRGGFRYIGNYMAGLGGLVRRPGLNQASTGVVAWPPIQDVVTIWSTDGTLRVLVLDQKFIYAMGATTMTPKYWSFTSKCGVGGSASSTITFTGGALSLTSKDLKAGDTLYAYSGAVVLLAEREIKSITSTTITVQKGALGVNLAGKTFDIRRAFAATNPVLVDYGLLPGGVVLFSDGARRITTYNAPAGTYGLYSSGTSCNFIPRCITTHKDRVWCAGIGTPGPFTPATKNLQRVIWSQVLDRTNFGVGQSQYVDLPYLPGAAKRILTLGQLLVAYFDDAIYVGQPTNYSGNTLPYSFQRLDTGRIGLAGMKGVVQFMNGHFFVGDDDIYFLGADLNLERIGNAIARDYVRYQPNRWGAYACVDPLNYRVLFGIPDGTGTFSSILSFDYLAKAWSIDEVTTLSMIARQYLIFSATWDTVLAAAPYTWDTGLGVYPAWDQISQNPGYAPPVYAGRTSKLYWFDGNLKSDYGGVPIATTIITGSRNEDLPGRNKTWLEFRLKLDRVVSVDVLFTLEGSKDGGVTWSTLTSRGLTIKSGYDEGQAQFRYTGDVAMFRARSSTIVEQYAVESFTVSFSDRGKRIRFAGNE